MSAPVNYCDHTRDQILALLRDVDTTAVVCVSAAGYAQWHTFKAEAVHMLTHARGEREKAAAREVLRRTRLLIARANVHETGAPCRYEQAGMTVSARGAESD